ncbi:MAG TPA: helix-turn-helix domain-containing protein [Verrucomicrobiae bacterium]|nr:helix-turn-helix domain-containing protein [Verrucomicrobiae bacterium]
MSDPAKKITSTMVVQLSTDELKAIIAEAVQSAMKALPRDDKLITVAEVSEILNCNEEWVYHNARELPFVRKVGGMLRFSSNGLQRYIESKKFSMT